MRKVILLVIVLAVIAAGWFFYFHKPGQITQVSISEAKIMDLANTLEFSGEVAPLHMYSVMSETGGTVASLNVSEGDTVCKGDGLFTLDATALNIQLEQAKLQYEALSDAQAQSVMAQGEGLSEAERSLQEQKIKAALALSQTTGYDYESFTEAFGQAAADTADAMAASLAGITPDYIDTVSDAAETDGGSALEIAQLTIDSLRDAIAKMSFYSLIDGTIVSVNIRKGEVLSPGIPALVIADTENIIIEGYVYEKDVSKLIEGQQVKIYTEKGYYRGTLTEIGKVAGQGDTSGYGTLTKVKITPDGGFSKMPGAVVDLEIILSSKDDVLAIPLECITDDDCVFVVNAQGKAEKRIVQTGFKDMYRTEIISGISEGEKVILSPDEIEEGQRVAYD